MQTCKDRQAANGTPAIRPSPSGGRLPGVLKLDGTITQGKG